MTEVIAVIPPINAGFTKSTSEFRTYSKRWLMLLLVSLNSIANAVLFCSITAINDVASRYWNVSHVVTNWIPNTFVLSYVVIALPCAYFLSEFGLRSSMIVASSLNAISACLHYAGQKQDQFGLVLAGQVSAALGIGIIALLPPRIATVWFPEREHAKATGIGILMNMFGLGIGFLQATHIVPDTYNIKEIQGGIFDLFVSQLIYALLCLILVYIFFKEAPPTAPSAAAAYVRMAKHKISYVVSLKKLAIDKNYQIFVHGFALYFGMFLFFTVTLNQLVSGKVRETNIGWMGFTTDCLAILSIIITTQIIDSFHCYRFLSMLLIFCAIGTWVLFTMLLLHNSSEYGLFATYAFMGVFGIPYIPIAFEQAAMMTYPVPEGTSCGIAMMMGNLYGFVFILCFGMLLDKGLTALVCYITIGIYALSFLLISCVRTTLNRKGVTEAFDEEEKKNLLDDESLPRIH